MGGFAETALAEVRARREAPVIALTEHELRSTLNEPEGLPLILRRKAQALTVEGRVLLDVESKPRIRSLRRRSVLPPARSGLVRADGSPWPVVRGTGEYSGFVFAQEIPDIDWVAAGGTGVTFDMIVPALDQSGLTNVFEELASMRWLTGAGSWKIEQSTTNWHGVGAASCLEAVKGWRARY